MAQWIKTTGETTEVSPKKGKKFKLEELQEYVGGYIERLDLGRGRNMLLNEDGKLIGLPFNQRATALALEGTGFPRIIVGHVLIWGPGGDVTSPVQRIAELNDLARTAMGVAGKLVQTQGISALPAHDQSRIREKVELYNDFNPGNNPHGERDMGFFEYGGNRIMWKIDYYDKSLEYGSEHPEDPGQTTRVLTIMLAEEY